MAYQRDSRALKQRMKGKWLDAFSYLAGSQLGTAIEKLGQNVTCPIDGDKEGFRLFKDANETGGGVKQSLQDEGVFPDGITLLMKVTGRRFTEAFDDLAAWLDGDVKKSENSLYSANHHTQQNQRTKHKTQKNNDDSNLREWLNNVWKYSHDLNHQSSEIGRQYLSNRRILDAALSSKDLRFNSKLTFKHDGKTIGHFPGLVGIVRDNNGKPVAMHRTFLNSQGEKLQVAETKATRKMSPAIGDSKGRVIRLADPVHGILGLAEGIETALSVTQATKIPVWSCLSATFMPQFEPPAGVHTVVVFVDVDKSEAGQKAAHKLQEALELKGVRVITLAPLLERSPEQKSVDWADQHIADLRTNSFAMQSVKHYFQSLIKQ